MSALATVIDALERRGCNVKNGKGPCPSHDDKNPSLSVTEAADGTVLLHCHAGCSNQTIMAELQLPMSALFEPESSNGKSKMEILATYDYVDEGGHPVYQVVRIVPKDFRQRRPDGAGGWVWNLSNIKRIPYRLPELIAVVGAGRHVFIVEGEKDVETLRKAGLAATCNSGGAEKWRKEYDAHFVDAKVVILPDNDEAGHKHRDQLVAHLAPVAASVRVVELPDLPEHGDVTDWLNAGHTVDELKRLVLEAEPEPTTSGEDSDPEADESEDVWAVSETEITGDHLNAKFFADVYGADVRYCAELDRWFVWNGAWWVEDAAHSVNGLARKTIDGLREWVSEADKDEMKRRVAHYVASTSAHRLDGLLKVARTLPGIAIRLEELDTHPHLLPCRNGCIDLRTGVLLPANRAHLMTRGVYTNYVPETRSDEWERFLAETLPDPEVLEFTQRLTGSMLFAGDVENLLPIFFGKGKNGKSTFTGAVQDVLGDYAITAPEGLLIMQKYDPHPERLAVLRGRRLVVSSELEKRATLAEGLVKMLTGGEKISARHLNRDRFEFAPSHHLLLVTNHKPKITGTDPAIWRRVLLVPFTETVAADRRIVNLRRILVAEHAEAILAWLVDGAFMWHRDGLGTSLAVTEATNAYRRDEDVLTAFMHERTEKADGQFVWLSVLYGAWKTWSGDNGERSGRQQDFRTDLLDHGYEVRTRWDKDVHRDRDSVSDMKVVETP